MSRAGPLRVLLGIHEQYTRERIREAFEQVPWAASVFEVVDFEGQSQGAFAAMPTADVAVQWLEYEDIDFDALLAAPGPMLVNAYPVRKGLIRKAQNAFYIRKHVAKRPDSVLATSVPETYPFSIEYPDYFEEAMSEVFEVQAALRENAAIDDPAARHVFIIKPSITNKAAEVFIFDSEDQLREMFERRYEESDGDIGFIREWVIQRYLTRPLLLYGGRKFHIRAYVLAVGNLRVYVYRDMLALFALRPFRLDHLHETHAHITNTCVQADAEDFSEADAVRRYWDMADDGQISEYDLEQIFAQICAITAEVFAAVHGEAAVFQPRPGAFELYGLDFLVDADRRVHYLETNAFPDFKQTGEALSALIATLFRETVAVAVAPRFGLTPAPPPQHMVLVLDRPGADTRGGTVPAGAGCAP